MILSVLRFNPVNEVSVLSRDLPWKEERKVWDTDLDKSVDFLLDPFCIYVIYAMVCFVFLSKHWLRWDCMAELTHWDHVKPFSLPNHTFSKAGLVL